MKLTQGSVIKSSAAKREPKAHAVSETAVSRLGNKVGNHTDKGTVPSKAAPLYEGRGYQEPKGPTSLIQSGPAPAEKFMIAEVSKISRHRDQ